jgi:hypothetical protein
MPLREIPITLNPHIATLKIRDSFLKKLDAALQFYPHLKVRHLPGPQKKKIKLKVRL